MNFFSFRGGIDTKIFLWKYKNKNGTDFKKLNENE